MKRFLKRDKRPRGENRFGKRDFTPLDENSMWKYLFAIILLCYLGYLISLGIDFFKYGLYPKN